MKLEGSCHCGAVKFTVQSHTPYPYMRCYLLDLPQDRWRRRLRDQHHGPRRSRSPCAARNSSACFARAIRDKANPPRHALGRSPALLCENAAGALWVWDPALDGLGVPVRVGDRHTVTEAAGGAGDHARLRRAVGGAIPKGRGHTHFGEYPEEGIADWHAKRGLDVK